MFIYLFLNHNLIFFTIIDYLFISTFYDLFLFFNDSYPPVLGSVNNCVAEDHFPLMMFEMDNPVFYYLFLLYYSASCNILNFTTFCVASFFAQSLKSRFEVSVNSVF